MSEKEKKEEKDYRAMIRARAQQSRGLRQNVLKEAKEAKTEESGLRQKIELEKQKKKADK